MKPTWLPAAILALIFPAWTAHATDLTKIERTIRKEPAYQTKTPKYCLLVFGTEAKTRMWLVHDGKVLLVDKNGDGDLTGADKRVEVHPKHNGFYTGPLSLADGKFQYSNLILRAKDQGRVVIQLNRKVDFAHRKQNRTSLTQMAGIRDIESRSWMNRDNIEEYEFRFADRPQDAPIVHFDGPLTLKPMYMKQVFGRGDKPVQFPVMVGTPGLGKGTFTQVLFVEGDPDGAAEIVFPNRNPDAKPIVVKVVLQSPD
jgi:hypothetical protein